MAKLSLCMPWRHMGNGGIAPLTANAGKSSVVFLKKSCEKNGHVCYYYI